MNNKNNSDHTNLIDFSKIVKDLLTDLNNTFSDKVESIINNDPDLKVIINFDISKFNNDNDDKDDTNKEFLRCVENIFNYCKTVYPERFFDILYQNEDMFTTVSNTCFLPNLKFSDLYYDTTSDKTKETLWKYLQLILFSVVTNIDNKESFGNSAQLFEAINSDEFKNKLGDTLKEMENLFNFKDNGNKDTDNNDNDNTDNNDSDDNDNSDVSKNSFNFENIFNSMNADTSNVNLPDKDNIHDHINNLINGKIGSLAKELAEETTKDLNLDTDNINDVNDVFKELFKNPTKLMSLVTNISTKLDKKMKDGSLKESELLEEATSIFKNMKSMPGMDNFDSLFKSMNLDQFLPKNGKFNNNAFQSMMDQNIKRSRTRERMKKKADQKNNGNQPDTQYSKNYEENNSNSDSNKMNCDTNNLNELNNNLKSLMEQFENNSFIDHLNLNQQNNTNNTNNTNNKRRNKKKHRPKK